MLESEAFSKKLIDTALENKQRDLELITSMPMFKATIKLCTAECAIITGFKKAHKTTLNNYLELLQQGVDNVQLLVNCKVYDQCVEFYKQDVAILKHAIYEYIIYMGSGRFFRSLFGFPRAEGDLFNFITGQKAELIQNE